MRQRDYRRAIRYAARCLLAEYRKRLRAELPPYVIHDMLIEDGREMDAGLIAEVYPT